MKKAILLTLLTCAGAALAPANVVISNAWNFDGTTDWDVSGANAADFSVSDTGIPRSDAATSWQNRASTDDGTIGANLGANRRFGEGSVNNVNGVAGPGTYTNPGDPTNYFIKFTINNDSLTDPYTIDTFSFGIGRNRSTNAYLYTSVVIGATETALTANAASSTAHLATIDWSSPLVQFGSSGTSNMWAKPVYSGIALSLDAGQSAEFRVYVADSDTSTTQWHFNNFEVGIVPEPATYAALFGLLALGIVVWRRRRA